MATCAVTGTVGDGATESEIVAGGGTIILTLTGDTWIASGGLLVTDDFNRTDENPLAGNWTTQPSSNALKIVTNTVRGSTNIARNGAYWSADTFNNNQYAQMKITTNDGAGPNIGPTVRQSVSAQTCYSAVASNGTPGYVRIRKFVTGTITNLGADISTNFADGDTLKLSVVGTTLEAFVNGVSVGTRTDSDIASGYGGIFIYSITAVGDDFEAGDV